MKANAYPIGLLVGVIIGLIVAALLVRYMNRDNKFKTQYDEMQQMERGKAFAYAFYTMMVLEALLIFVSLFGISLPMSDAVVHFTMIVIGVMVLACYCVWHGAYVGLNTNMKRYSIIAIFAGGVNLLSAVMAIANGTMIANGQLSTPFINLLCAVMLIVIGVLMWIKKKIDASEEKGEEQ